MDLDTADGQPAPEVQLSNSTCSECCTALRFTDRLFSSRWCTSSLPPEGEATGAQKDLRLGTTSCSTTDSAPLRASLRAYPSSEH